MYYLREKQKDEGWRKFHNRSLPFDDRRDGLLAVIYSHYVRSLEAWCLSHKSQHPMFEEYASTWLWALGDHRPV